MSALPLEPCAGRGLPECGRCARPQPTVAPFQPVIKEVRCIRTNELKDRQCLSHREPEFYGKP